MTDSPAPLDPLQAFAELGRIPLGDLTVAQVMERIARLAQTCVPGADEVSVTLVEDGEVTTIAFTGSLAADLDERQYQDGYGPCTDALATGGVIRIPDVEDDERYPEFSRAARRAGARASLSVGMPVPQRTTGSLNLYSRSTGAFDTEAVEVARVFADYAAVALVNASLLASKTRLAREMQQAMATRATIEQAKGILIGRLGIGPDQALQHLATQSQRTGRTLDEVAAQIVADVADLAEDGG